LKKPNAIKKANTVANFVTVIFVITNKVKTIYDICLKI